MCISHFTLDAMLYSGSIITKQFLDIVTNVLIAGQLERGFKH